MARLHLIGNAHLDPVWLWRWQEGIGEIHSTFRSVLDRMNEFPNFKFSCAGSMYYEWIENFDYDMFCEIKQRISQGRWCVTGGWYLQPDCNIPCGESLVRQAIIGQRYFKEKFGVTAQVGYNVDSFGHNAALPQILKKSGLNAYVFMRPSEVEQKNDKMLFLWKSSDGTQIPAHRIVGQYNFSDNLNDGIKNTKQKTEKTNSDLMFFYGVGNHGGGPTIKLLEQIENYNDKDLIYSTPDEYFSSINKENLPIITGELQHHARGCYSANTFAKMYNSICENNLLLAERISVMAQHLCGIEYPLQEYKKAWKNVLFNQFHDILGGCCIKKAYDDAGYLYGETMSITERQINFALRSMAKNIDTLQGETLPCFKKTQFINWHVWEHEVLGTPVVVFNPNAFKVSTALQINLIAKKMTAENGKEIPFQIVRGDQTNCEVDRYHTTFTAELEPFGYRVYRVFLEKRGTQKFENSLKISKNSIENSKIRVEFSTATGDICRIYDKENKKDLLTGQCTVSVLDETECDTWAHYKDKLGNVVCKFEKPEFTVIEKGPVRATLRVKTRCQDSVLLRDYTLCCDSDEIKISAKVDFNIKHAALKICFPTDTDNTVCGVPFGAITRKNDYTEEPFNDYLSFGDICVAAMGKHGYDTTKDSVRITVLRTAIWADHVGVRDEFCEHMDLGVHRFTYYIFPFKNNASAQKTVQKYKLEPRYVFEGFHNGNLAESLSLINCDNENIVISAIKQGEDRNEPVVRFYNAQGENEKVSITLFDKTINTNISQFEIKTFATNGDELNLIEF